MSYYFKLDDYPEAKTTNGKFRTGKLKELAISKVEQIENELKKVVSQVTHSSDDLHHYWVTKSTFGFVFSDFEKSKGTINIIGPGYKKLFEKIQNDYYCLVLSKNLPHNMSEPNYNDKKILIVNINYFKSFAKVISSKNVVSLFLYRFDDDEIEQIIRSWIIESPDKFQKIKDSHEATISEIATLLEKFKIRSLNELSDFMNYNANILRSKIEENYELFKEKLDEFGDLIQEEKVILPNEGDIYHNLENKLRKFIQENPWIVDFTYNKNDVKTHLKNEVDVILVGSYLSYKKGLLIELKRPDVEVEKFYRDRDAVTAHVSNAISQLIHYTRELKESESELITEGMIIIGRNMGGFIPIFNQYLHNVRIKTYEDIYEDAKRRLANFASGPRSSDNKTGNQSPSQLA